ncbi:hypothetical protein BH10ACT7_BH10ACT7_12000 [soil metagenome]
MLAGLAATTAAALGIIIWLEVGRAAFILLMVVAMLVGMALTLVIFARIFQPVMKDKSDRFQFLIVILAVIPLWGASYFFILWGVAGAIGWAVTW